MSASSHAQIVGRRSEILAELFLQELGPTFLSRPTQDLGFDFLVGFNNTKGGLNTFAVEVKGTDTSITSSFSLDRSSYRRLVRSNLPVFLLAVDVKQNRLFYGWPKADEATVTKASSKISVPVVEVNDTTKAALRRRLVN